MHKKYANTAFHSDQNREEGGLIRDVMQHPPGFADRSAKIEIMQIWQSGQSIRLPFR